MGDILERIAEAIDDLMESIFIVIFPIVLAFVLLAIIMSQIPAAIHYLGLPINVLTIALGIVASIVIWAIALIVTFFCALDP